MRNLILSIAVLLTVGIASSYSHEIRLKNGNVITTEHVRIIKDTVIYEQFGSVITIPRSRVKEIVYKETPGNISGTAEQQRYDKPIIPSPSGKNLAARLEAHHAAKTPLEKACMCTLALKTGTGFGSGFFISKDGLIITSRHVVRGDEEQNRQITHEFEQYLRDIKELKRQLDREYKEIIKYKADLKREWALFKDIKQEARTDLDRRYLESQRIALLDFKKYLREKETTYKAAKKTYLKKKNEIEKEYKQFQYEQNKLSYQNSFEVVLADDTKLNSTLLKVSRNYDLALLKISGYQTPYLKPVDQNDLAQGQNVYALGSPISLSMKNSISSGVLSGFRENLIQTNAQIYPGNSGGPLIDENGEVIGVVTMKLVSSEFEGGPGFAIPIGVVLSEFNQHLQNN